MGITAGCTAALELAASFWNTHTHTGQISGADPLESRLSLRGATGPAGQAGCRSAGSLSHGHAGSALGRSTGGVA